MPKKATVFKQGDSVQGPGSKEQVEEEYYSEEDLLFDSVISGGLVEGKEGGLRVDMFEHDDPDDLPCVCDLPVHAQDIIISESDFSG
tara:strand:- start:408 stop:668 length:261 start_codon:yes stop_codon:yes gene_type:complete